MEHIFKKIDLYFIALFVDVFIIVSYSFFFLNEKNITNFIMLGILFISIIYTYFSGIIKGLLASGIIVFIYATYKLYENFLNLKYTENYDYIWVVFIPLSVFIVGKLVENINIIQNKSLKLESEYKELVTIDKNTGLSNLRGFYYDLDREISRVKRHKISLTLMIIKISYYDELKSVLGEESLRIVVEKVVAGIKESTRNEDIRYNLKESTFAILMAETDVKGAEIVEDRIREKIKNLNLYIKENKKNIDLEVKIGAVQYSEKISGALEFRELVEKELEYDV
ncbi:GGDEF domain-containing protein [Clostridium frigidicarnis]|uniref:Diguanylate cyclase (GGDEF) domain-containing protein n=1 Tax=Clostridium frigidicarnis TaxID=84698 RepID=A0A1I0XY80_9CLOT|nr:diguanylate cyclase [Clostridium frigidicarnis]SFB05874.1 diguanylate cyclase (GGDEF) domain-containing protein [Clostridium frigidicarnis]